VAELEQELFGSIGIRVRPLGQTYIAISDST
jgi:hypothetical protein